MKKSIILTDLDGTLTRKSLVLSHAGFLIEQGIIKDNGSYKAWLSDIKNESLIVEVAQNYRNEIIGMSIESLFAKKFVKEFYDKKSNWYSTMNLLKEHKERGSRIILITGSSDFLVKELAEILDVEFFASEYEFNKDGIFTGNVKGMFNKEQKSLCLEDIDLGYHNEVEVEAWGDTMSDSALFAYGDYNILVDPSKETLINIINDGVKIDEVITR